MSRLMTCGHAIVAGEVSGMGRLSAKMCIVVLLFQFAAALSASAVYLLWNNTLATNGKWHSSKCDVKMGLMAAHTFTATPQALARGHLNLAAWHGFQEVVYGEPVDIQQLDCRIVVRHGMYIHVIYHRNDDEFWGIRLSSAPQFPQIAYRASMQGKFLERVPIEHSLLEADHWHHLRLCATDGMPSLSVDGQPVKLEGLPHRPFNCLGFRGAMFTPILVDDIVAKETDGHIIQESFINLRHAAIILPGAWAIAIALSALVGTLMRRRGLTPLARAISLVFFNGLAAGTLACAFVIVFLSQHKYPPEGLVSDETVNRAQNVSHEKLSRRVERLKTEETSPTYTIVFLGTSQTHGAGAALFKECWVARIGEELNKLPSSSPRYRCIRAAIEGGNSTGLVDVYRDLIPTLHPQVLVINLGTNDNDSVALAANLHRLIDMSEEHGIRTMILLEPNSIEIWPGDLPNHPAMRQVAQERGVPCIELHEFMKSHYDDGILWWDFVHPTSFGHKLIADRVLQALRDNHLLEPESSPPLVAGKTPAPATDS